MSIDYSQYKYSDEKFLKKMYSLLGEENFKRMVEIANQYCVTKEYQIEVCDRKCAECFINFIKDKEEIFNEQN